MEKEFLDSSSSDIGKSEDAGEGEGDSEYVRNNNDLTQLQEDVIYAIETLNKALFIDLGG